ncbi:MAG: membrane protein insertase YidC [Chloroflexi bacterium]|nr:membrane protein insertase YidC [Chloroflexota bacterium]
MEAILFIWNEGILRPMLNSLVLLYVFLFDNFGLSILTFTVIVRVLTLPLTLRQLRQMKSMSLIQPKIKELQKRYEKDKPRFAQEQMRLYKEHGINPIGCLGPMIIQFPIWIGLYQAIIQTLPANPESLAGLARHLYAWLPSVNQAVPLESGFLWLDLAFPDPTPVLPVLVGVSMWVQQKMTTLPTSDPRQAQQNTMMLWMMPIMFTIFSFQFPSGLSFYWVVSNLVGIAIQYFVTGWGTLFTSSRIPEPVPAAVAPISAGEEENHGSSRNISEDSSRGRGARPKAARRKSRGGRDKHR